MADIVTRLLELVQQHGPAEAEKVIRHTFGGNEVYIAKGRDVLARRREDAIAQALQSGVKIDQAFSIAGVSRSTGFKILARPARRRR